MSFLNLIGQNYTLRLVSHLIATGISKDESDDDQLLYLPYINSTLTLHQLYSEPTEARIPKTKWRLYPFKGDDSLPTMYIHRNRCLS